MATSPGPAERVFARLAEPFTAEAVFDCLPDAVYFIKNERARYVVVNRTLVDRCGLPGKHALIGKTAAQVFREPLGTTYWQQDLKLLATGKPIDNELELHLYPTGLVGWCLTNKMPLRDAHGTVVGLVGVSHDLHLPNEDSDEYRDVVAAVRHAQSHLGGNLTVGLLAKVARLSPWQFDQRIRRLFRLTTGQLLLKLRMDHATAQLRETDRPIATISLSSGYADQSAFTRQFHRAVGMTPAEFRKSFRG